MIIKALIENTSSYEGLKAEHGLSLYIETPKQKLLFDVGQSSSFIDNAERLKVDLSEVDLVVISHGHYDHGGGLKSLMGINQKARIYLHAKAFNPHYSNRNGGETAYIGLDQSLLPNERFVFTEDYLRIDEELELFSCVKGNLLRPSGNKDLLMLEEGIMTEDDFSHEQNLLIYADGKKVLLAGCAHTGILNIMEHVRTMGADPVDAVIGGFHLYNIAKKQYEDDDRIAEVGNVLNETKAVYHTCHCTGMEAYHKLKTAMDNKIHYFSTGQSLIIEQGRRDT